MVVAVFVAAVGGGGPGIAGAGDVPDGDEGVVVALGHVEVLEVVALLEVDDGVEQVLLGEHRPFLGERVEHRLPEDEPEVAAGQALGALGDLHRVEVGDLHVAGDHLEDVGAHLVVGLGEVDDLVEAPPAGGVELVGVVGCADEQHLVFDQRDLVDALEERVDRALDGGVFVAGAGLGEKSNSSTKRIHGERRVATSKTFSTFLAVSPRYWEVIIDSFTSTNGRSSSLASARATDDYGAALDEAAPDGVDAYFDNVGGPITDAVFTRLNLDARVAVCGQISLYNATERPMGPRKLPGLVSTRAKVEGFLVRDFAPRYGEATQQLGQWVASGDIQYRETVTEGLENAPDAFLGLFEGENIGKQLVKVSDADE